MSINVGTAVAFLTLDTGRFTSSLQSAKGDLNKFLDSSNSAGTRLQSLGSAMSSTGATLTKYVTAPLVGAGALIAKVGGDFEASMSKVRALSGATGDDFKKLEGIAKEMGATTQFSATQSAEALQYMALAGWNTEQMVAGIPGVLALAASAGMDLAQASDIVTDTMSAFQMEATRAGEAADIFAAAQANANTDVLQLGEAMKYAGAAANAAGMDLAQTNTVLGILADSGIKGSQAGTTFTAMLRDMKKNADDGKLAVGDMTVALYNADGTMRDIGSVMKDVGVATKDMTTQQRDMALGALFGEQALKGVNIMLATGSERYEELEKKIRNSNGAAKEMADIMNDNLKGSITKLKSALEGALISLSTTLIPIINKAAVKTNEWVDRFNALDDSTKEMIVKLGLFAAAAGPVLLVTGKIIGTVGTVITTFSALSGATAGAGAAMAATSGATAGAGSALAALAGPVGIGIAAIAGVTVAGIALYKHLQQESIPAIQRFGEEVSEATKEAVGGFLDLQDEATKALNQMNWSGQEITSEMAENITGTFDTMNKQVLEGLDRRHQEEYSKLKQHFATSSALTEEEETEILTKIQESHNEQIKSTEEKNARIKEIMETASREKRSLTKSEQEEINRIQDEMKELGIKALSESEIESKAILERMRAQANEITAQQAAEVVRNSNEQKEQTIKAAEEQYESVTREIIKQRDELGTISAEQAQKLIQEAKKQRDETVRHAEEMHQNIVKEAREQAVEHVDQVDWETGQILTKWESFRVNLSKKWTSLWEDAKRKTADILAAWNQSPENSRIGNLIGPNPTSLRTFHSGGWVTKDRDFSSLGLRQDEVPAILQEGEYVLSKQMIGDMQSNKDTNTPTVVNFEKMFDGANFIINNENDAKALVRGFYDLQQNSLRAMGVTR